MATMAMSSMLILLKSEISWSTVFWIDDEFATQNYCNKANRSGHTFKNIMRECRFWHESGTELASQKLVPQVATKKKLVDVAHKLELLRPNQELYTPSSDPRVLKSSCQR